MGSRGQGFMLGCCLLLAVTWGPVLSLVPRVQEEQQEWEETEELTSPLDHVTRPEETHKRYSPSLREGLPTSRCYRCCDSNPPVYQTIPPPQINITILKGERLRKWRGGQFSEAAFYRWRGRRCRNRGSLR